MKIFTLEEKIKIKKFYASSVKDAMQQIKKTFGDDAYILKTKQIKNAESPSKKIEVTAAIEKKGEIKKQFKKKYRKRKPVIPNDSDDRFEISGMKNDIANLSHKIEEMFVLMKRQSLPNLPKLFQNKYKELLDNGVESNIAFNLINEVLNSYSAKDKFDEETIEKLLFVEIAKKIKVSDGLKNSKKKSNVVTIIGSSGAGKTTNLTKIAALYKYKFHKKVAVISLDSYHISAAEHLRRFSKISEIPCESLYSDKELISALEKYKKFDLILIDTYSTKLNDSHSIISYKEIIRLSGAKQNLLLLDLKNKLSDQVYMINKLKSIPFTGIVFTKLDETRSFGNILNIAANYEIDISFLSFGESIPKHCKIANKKDIANLILRGKYEIL